MTEEEWSAVNFQYGVLSEQKDRDRGIKHMEREESHSIGFTKVALRKLIDQNDDHFRFLLCGCSKGLNAVTH